MITKSFRWGQLRPFFDALRQNGARGVLGDNSSISDAFNIQEELGCIDGGIKKGIRIAGAGVLLDRDHLKQVVRENGIKKFVTHDGCGAFAKAFPDMVNHDQGAAEWGKDMANELGIPHMHVPSAKLVRPPGFHDEIGVYYDATNMFSRTEDMPPGFVISRLSKEMGQNDLDLALNIALSSSGFGERFSSATPFYVIIIASPTKHHLCVKELKAEAQEITKRFPKGKIAISGFRTHKVLREAAM
jgi:hypothetical protein